MAKNLTSVFNVIQVSNVDGEILVSVTPCADFESAKSVMDEKINTLLSEETSKYFGLDLDSIEEETQDGEDCDFTLERYDISFHLTCEVDDYYEHIDIEEKKIVKKG